MTRQEIIVSRFFIAAFVIVALLAIAGSWKVASSEMAQMAKIHDQEVAENAAE